MSDFAIRPELHVRVGRGLALGRKPVSVACEPSLWPLLPSLRGNGFWTPETDGPKLPLKRSFFPPELPLKHWPAIQQHLTDTMIRLDKALRPYVHELGRS
jgi:hypothetical protein